MGAVGVVVSLSYLAIQLRMTRLSDKKRALESSYLIYNDIRRSLIENEDLTRIFAIGLSDPQKLTDLERIRFMALSETIFLNAESFWRQLDGGSDERLQRILEFLADYLTTPGGRMFWSHPQSQNLSQSFRERMERQESAGSRVDEVIRAGHANRSED